jgi:hypothetical protein
VDPSIPWRDPISPAPDSGHSPYTPAQQARFRTWMESLQTAGFGNRRGTSGPDNAYQLRTAGYPERELELPPEARGGSGKGMMADGIRPADGYAVDAKYTRETNGATPSARSNKQRRRWRRNGRWTITATGSGTPGSTACIRETRRK